MPEINVPSWNLAVQYLSPGLIIVLPDGTVDQVNESFIRTVHQFGIAADFRWQGLSIFELPQVFSGKMDWISVVGESYPSAISEVLSGTEPSYSTEFYVETPCWTGWFRCEAATLYHTDQQTRTGMLISYQDISQYKQREFLLERKLSLHHSLHGHIPVCAVCKHVPTLENWEPLEIYLESRLPIEFTHDICPACIRRLYPKYSAIFDNNGCDNPS